MKYLVTGGAELGWLPETRFHDGIKKQFNVISGEYQNYYQRMYGDRV